MIRKIWVDQATLYDHILLSILQSLSCVRRQAHLTSCMAHRPLNAGVCIGPDFRLASVASEGNPCKSHVQQTVSEKIIRRKPSRK